jgi:phage terminase large subunit-like protein
MWRHWLLLGGRGAGKTDAGSHYVDSHARGRPCGPWGHRIAIVAPTLGDARKLCIRGVSGIIAANPTVRFIHEDGLVRWPGLAHPAEATIFGAYTPEDTQRLRGPQHCLAWLEEFASWRQLSTSRSDPEDALDMLRFGLRLGAHPRMVITTTPKNRYRVKELIQDPATVTTLGSTFDNPALSKDVLDDLLARYQGTRLGLQELYAKLLDDDPRALWRRSQIDSLRALQVPQMKRAVVAVDPAVTSNPGSDETGIIGAGLGADGHGYVLDDKSMRGSPGAWARAAVALFHKIRADHIVAEVNNGGELVATVIHSVDSNVPVVSVTATRGKVTRAEPVSHLYEQMKVHHVGTFPELEDQQCQWVPGEDENSPDRVDALVWGLTDLMLTGAWGGISGSASGVA